MGMMGLVLRNGMWSELDIFKMVSGGVVCCSMVAVVHGEVVKRRKKELTKMMSFLI